MCQVPGNPSFTFQGGFDVASRMSWYRDQKLDELNERSCGEELVKSDFQIVRARTLEKR